MEFCSCENKVWEKTRLINRVLTHGSCEKPLACLKCNEKSPAINLSKDGPECESCSPIFTEEFLHESFDLEKNFFDGFIYHAGGIRVRDLLAKEPDFDNADYYFTSDDVLIEFKILKTEFAQTPEHLEKFEKLILEWFNEGKLTKAQYIGIEPSPPEFVRAHMSLVRKPIEKITQKANNQIKRTKESLSLETAQGLVLYLIDGFYQANPYLTIKLIGDPLTRQMKSVDGYVVFSLRRKITIPGDPYERFFWEPKYREKNNKKLSAFVNRLGADWFRYLEHISGQKFADNIEDDNPDTLLARATFSANG